VICRSTREEKFVSFLVLIFIVSFLQPNDEISPTHSDEEEEHSVQMDKREPIDEKQIKYIEGDTFALSEVVERVATNYPQAKVRIYFRCAIYFVKCGVDIYLWNIDGQRVEDNDNDDHPFSRHCISKTPYLHGICIVCVCAEGIRRNGRRKEKQLK
jgi:hypothetical protein